MVSKVNEEVLEVRIIREVAIRDLIRQITISNSGTTAINLIQYLDRQVTDMAEVTASEQRRKRIKMKCSNEKKTFKTNF